MGLFGTYWLFLTIRCIDTGSALHEKERQTTTTCTVAAVAGFVFAAFDTTFARRRDSCLLLGLGWVLGFLGCSWAGVVHIGTEGPKWKVMFDVQDRSISI